MNDRLLTCFRGFALGVALFGAATASGTEASADDAPPAACQAAQRLEFAEELLRAGQNRDAALEFRRIAADSEDAEDRAALEMLAAASYLGGGDLDRARRALERGEDNFSGPPSVPAYLRLAIAEGRRQWLSASLYAETLRQLADDSGDANLSSYAASARVADALLARDFDEARAAAADDPQRLAVVDAYLRGSDKSPTVGGLLGLVPGLGYAYSGEWGNALRSIVLNGLFGWAMYETAERDQWALFGVSTFFELTWYSGSIYGGIDAAERRNRERLEKAASELRQEPAPAVRRGSGIDLFRVGLAF